MRSVRSLSSLEARRNVSRPRQSRPRQDSNLRHPFRMAIWFVHSVFRVRPCAFELGFQSVASSFVPAVNSR